MENTRTFYAVRFEYDWNMYQILLVSESEEVALKYIREDGTPNMAMLVWTCDASTGVIQRTRVEYV